MFEQLLLARYLNLERAADEIRQQLRVVGQRDIRCILAGHLGHRHHVVVERNANPAGEDRGIVGRDGRVLQIAHRAGEVRPVELERLDVEPRRPDHQQVVPAVGQLFDVAQLSQRTGGIRHGPTTNLGAFADGQHAKRGSLLAAVTHHGAVAVFEDVQAQRHVRKEHRVQRKQRELNCHGGASQAARQFLVCLMMRSRRGSPGCRAWRNAISTPISFWRMRLLQIGQRSRVMMSFCDVTPLDSLIVFAMARMLLYCLHLNTTRPPGRIRRSMAPRLLRALVNPARATAAVAAVGIVAGCGSAVPVTGLAKAATPTCATPGPASRTDSFAQQVTLITAKSGLKYGDIRVGCGAPVQTGQRVSIQYTGWLASGTVFDTSRQPGRTAFTFLLGGNQVIPGLEDGLRGMRVGGHRRLVLPPSLAYGFAGRPPVIPPKATLTIDVEVLGTA